jgi:hypothetical protein
MQSTKRPYLTGTHDVTVSSRAILPTRIKKQRKEERKKQQDEDIRPSRSPCQLLDSQRFHAHSKAYEYLEQVSPDPSLLINKTDFEADPLLHIGGSEESSYSPVKEKRIDSMAGPMLQIDSKQGEINSYSERANPFSADSLLQIGSEKESSYAD